MGNSYFRWLQPIFYRGKVAPNLITRAKLPDQILNNRRLFHPYQIEDGDRPDTIAHFYYGDDYYDWIVLLSNNMISVRDEWPLTNDELNDFITEKYGSLQSANQQIVYYQIDNTISDISNIAYASLPANHLKYWTIANVGTYSIKQDTLQLSVAGYSALPVDEQSYWRAVTAYEAAFEENEAKRLIYLIDVQYVPEVERSLKIAFDG